MTKEQKLESALSILMNENFYYYSFITDFEIKFVKSKAIAYVSFNKKSQKISINIGIDKVEYLTPTSLKFILEHECEHLACRHLEMAASNMTDLSDPKNAEAFNRSQDYLINGRIKLLIDNSTQLLSVRKELEPKIKALGESGQVVEAQKLISENMLSFILHWAEIADIEELKGRTPFDVDFIELYNILNKKDESQSQNKQKSQDSADQLSEVLEESQMEIDSHGTPSDQASDPTSSETREIPQHIIDQNLNKAKEEFDKVSNSKQAGNIPGSAQMRLNELTKNTQSLKSTLSMFKQSVTNSLKKKTWSKVSRRYPNQTKGKRKDKVTDITVWLDSSGSQWTEEIMKKCLGVIKHLVDLKVNVKVLVGDTELQGKIDFSKVKFSIGKIQLNGGGGTNPQFVFDYAKKNNSDGVVLLTDGYVMNFDKFKIPTLAVLIGSQVKEIENTRNIKVS
jgi:predicted metal-dependent peptidase